MVGGVYYLNNITIGTIQFGVCFISSISLAILIGIIYEEPTISKLILLIPIGIVIYSSFMRWIEAMCLEDQTNQSLTN